MKVWIGDGPAPKDTDWFCYPNIRCIEDARVLIKDLEDCGISAFMVDLYSVDDVFWLEILHEGAEGFCEMIGLDSWIINCHVHSDNIAAINFIKGSPYLNYVPLAGI